MLNWPKDLVAILACPKCKGDLEQLAEPEGFGCARCGLFFPVVEGIPNFVLEDAVPWDPATKPGKTGAAASPGPE